MSGSPAPLLEAALSRFRRGRDRQEELLLRLGHDPLTAQVATERTTLRERLRARVAGPEAATLMAASRGARLADLHARLGLAPVYAPSAQPPVEGGDLLDAGTGAPADLLGGPPARPAAAPVSQPRLLQPPRPVPPPRPQPPPSARAGPEEGSTEFFLEQLERRKAEESARARAQGYKSNEPYVP